ncbi:MAG: hypothetical protein ACP5LD_15960, partial [Desulfomonilaceae bacterium]
FLATGEARGIGERDPVATDRRYGVRLGVMSQGVALGYCMMPRESGASQRRNAIWSRLIWVHLTNGKRMCD